MELTKERILDGEIRKDAVVDETIYILLIYYVRYQFNVEQINLIFQIFIYLVNVWI